MSTNSSLVTPEVIKSDIVGRANGVIKLIKPDGNDSPLALIAINLNSYEVSGVVTILRAPRVVIPAWRVVKPLPSAISTSRRYL